MGYGCSRSAGERVGWRRSRDTGERYELGAGTDMTATMSRDGERRERREEETDRVWNWFQSERVVFLANNFHGGCFVMDTGTGSETRTEGEASLLSYPNVYFREDASHASPERRRS